LRRKQELAASHAERIGEMSVRKREEEKKDEEMKLLAYVNKTMNIKTKRNVAEKDRKSMIIATRPEKDHHERLTEVK